MTDSKFDFYEVVRLEGVEPVPTKLWYEEGAVVGKAQNSAGEWEYAVQVFADNNECSQLPEAALSATGKRVRREDLYSGESVRVAVDPDTGEGSGE